MLLAIDSGNTNVVFAIFDENGALCEEWRASTPRYQTSDEYGVWLLQLMAFKKFSTKDISDIIIATVVPSALYDLKTLCRKYFGIEPIVVGEKGVDLGISIKVDLPEEVGADRLVNAKAADKKYKGPLIVIDFGTATTFDIIEEDGSYCGGAIAPGINLSIEALHKAAAKLPRVPVKRPQKVIGSNTIDAMLSGIFWGYVSLIEGMIVRIKAEYGAAKMQTVATGGLAPLFSAHSSFIEVVDETLTLQGLYYIYEDNKGKFK